MKIPEGFRLVTCDSCGKQTLVPEEERENCKECGKLLPKY